MKRLAMIATAVLAAATLSAQVPPAAATQPTDPEKYVDSLLRAKPGTARPLQPVTAEEATAEPVRRKKSTPSSTQNVPVKRDGDIASERIGYLQRTPDDSAWQYSFESADLGMTDPPMHLVPNSRLATMEQAQETAGAPVRFKVTGLITSYRGKNYLLVENVREWPKAAAITESAATQPTTEPATQPSTLPATQATQPIDPEAALEQLLRPRPRMAAPLETPAANDAATTAQGVAPAITQVLPVREGEMITQRVGRLQKAEGKESKFIFDSDERALADPPMPLVPNQKLAQMEDTLERAGVDLRFRVTGLITTYRGQNYLLVEKAELVTDHEGL